MTATDTQPTDPMWWAEHYASLGLRVVPIAPGRKHPALPAWQDAATNDPDTIHNWWTGLYRGHGVGIALGPQPNGLNLFALDGDGAEGTASVSAMITERNMPRTVTARTGGGGIHLVYSAPADIDVRNQQTSGNRVAPKVDVRGAGGQIVVAPTTHPESGADYTWVPGRAPGEFEFAEAPPWLLELVAPSKPTPSPAPTEPANRIDYTQQLTTDETPADWLRRRWSWDAELRRHGWTLAKQRGDDAYWVRPGKDPRSGHSAVLHGADGPFVVFTTEIPADLAGLGTVTKDGSGRSYSPLEWVAAHEHQGSLSDTTRALRADMTAPQAPSMQPTKKIDPHTGEIATVTEPEPEHERPFGVEFVGFHHEFPPPVPLIDGLLDLGTVGVLYARWGCFKSFLAIDWALHVACGMDWYGHRVAPGAAAILAYEAPVSIHRRVHAWAKYHQMVPSDRRYMLGAGRLPRLTSHALISEVRHQLDDAEVSLVIVDTIARGGVGADMNTNEADEVFAGLHMLASPERTVIGIGHAGKDASRGLRGFSAQEDQVDFLFRLDRERDSNTQQPKGPATLTAPKAKDREPPSRTTFDLVGHERLEPEERVLVMRGDVAPATAEPPEQPIDIAIRNVRNMLSGAPDRWVPVASVAEACKRPRSGVGRPEVRRAVGELVEEQYLEMRTEAGGDVVRMTPDSRFLEGQ